MTIPLIETERLRLRGLIPDDLDDLFEVFGDAEVVKYLSIGKPRSREETLDGLLRTVEGWQNRGFGLWAVALKENGKVIGYCGLIFLEETTDVEIAYGFARAFWGRGYATEAARPALRFGFEELKLERIVAVVNPENVSSQRVLEKLGMNYVRMAHHYNTDLMLYERLRENFQSGVEN